MSFDDMVSEGKFYVTVAESGIDLAHEEPSAKKVPTVFSTFLSFASKDHQEQFIKELGGRFGECRIARLIFEPDKN